MEPDDIDMDLKIAREVTNLSSLIVESNHLSLKKLYYSSQCHNNSFEYKVNVRVEPSTLRGVDFVYEHGKWSELNGNNMHDTLIGAFTGWVKRNLHNHVDERNDARDRINRLEAETKQLHAICNYLEE